MNPLLSRSRRARRVAVLAMGVVVAITVLVLSPLRAGAAAESRDVARDAVATARSEYPFSSNFAAANVNDGNPATRWGSRYSRSNPNDTYDVNGEWVQLQLAQPTYILNVVLDWEVAYSTEYDIEVSHDGIGWTTLRTVTTPTGQSVGGHLLQEFNLDTSDAWEYIRIVSRGAATKYGLSLWRFEVWDTPASSPDPTAANVALGGTATAKSSYNLNGMSLPASNAIDGDPATRWGSRYTRTSPNDSYDPAADWLQVELAAPTTIHKIVVHWEAAYAKRFEIQASNDGAQWTVLNEVTGASAGVHEYVLDTDASYRFIRLQGVETATRYGYSVYELEIWNAAPVVAPVVPGEIVPAPRAQTALEGAPFHLDADARIVAEDYTDVAELLAAELRAATGFDLPIVDDDETAGDIVIRAGAAAEEAATGFSADESYRLHATHSAVEIEAPTSRGAFNATRTLLQLLPPWIAADTPDFFVDWTIAPIEIVDFPRFEARGVMLDPARNFVDVESVEKIIDEMAALKLNRLHLHLTDDQGWRLQIKSWPELTAKGSVSSIAGGISGSYSQDDFVDIVRYAHERFIEVIPEVDVPGHVDAALHSYPELHCTGAAVPIRTTAGISTNALCVTKPIVYDFLDDVIAEIAAISPSPYIHIGADEAEGVSSVQYGEFVRRVEQIAAAHGKKIIGWTPVPAADPSGDAVHQYWADRKNHMSPAWFAGDRKVILSPTERAYLDYRFLPGQSLGFRDPIYTTRNSYNWDPTSVVDQTTLKNLNSQFGLTERNVLGIEGAMWGETLKRGLPDIEYMLWPRLAGLADKAWAPRERTGNFDVFAERLATLGSRLQIDETNFWADPEVHWRPALAGSRLELGEDTSVDGAIATLSAPGAKRSDVTAIVAWGDGSTSSATVSGTDASDSKGPSLLTIAGTHEYGGAGTYTGSVEVVVPGREPLVAPIEIVVDDGEPAQAAPIVVLINGASPTSVVAGEPIHLEVSGLGAATPISIELHSDPVVLANGTSDEQGGYSAELTVPESIDAGEHTLRLLAVDSLGATVNVDFPLTVRSTHADGTGHGGAGSASTADSDADDPKLASTGVDATIALGAIGMIVVGARLAVARRRARRTGRIAA